MQKILKRNRTSKKISSLRIGAAFLAVTVLILGTFIFSLMSGSVDISMGDIWDSLFGRASENARIVYDVRLPRLIIALMAGAGLAVSGTLLQAVMKNPLTDPGIIGISSAAALVAAVVSGFFPMLFYSIPVFAVLGGMLAYILIYTIAWDGGVQPVRLILVGVALNLIFIGLIQGIAAFSGGGSNLTQTQSIVNGSITQKTWADVRLLTSYTVAALILAVVFFRKCNLLLLDDRTARGLGVNVDRDRFIVAMVGIILAAAATSIVGPIGFVGLLVPHIGRMIVGAGHGALIPFSAMAGAWLLLISDTIGRVAAYPFEIPAAILMSVIGGPFFIVLLKIGGKDYGN